MSAFNWSQAISELLISLLFFPLILLSAIYRVAYYLCEIVYHGCEVAKLILFIAKFTMYKMVYADWWSYAD
jgi:hypothetical protein